MLSKMEANSINFNYVFYLTLYILNTITQYLINMNINEIFSLIICKKC